MTKIASRLACTFILLVANSSFSTQLPSSEERSLGTAYRTGHAKLLQTPCMEGKEIESVTGSGAIEYTANGDYDRIFRHIAGGLEIHVDVPIIGGVEGLAQIAWEHATTQNSLSWNYIFNAQTHSRRFEQGSEKIRERIMDRLSSSAEDLEPICGNEYISQVDYGASLIVSLKFDFLRASDKTDVAGKLVANINIAEVIKASGEAKLDLNFSKFSETVKVRIIANQFGGDHSKLSEILSTSIIDCELDKFTPCRDTLKRIIEYGSSELVKQLETKGSDETRPLKVLRYHTSPYEETESLRDLVQGPPQVFLILFLREGSPLIMNQHTQGNWLRGLLYF